MPEQFIDWLECQHLSSKEMVELLSQCLDAGYHAVMAGTASSRTQNIEEDTVPVQTVHLEAYDTLYGKGVTVS